MKFLYTTHITKSHGGLQFYFMELQFYSLGWDRIEIGRLTHPLNPSMNVKDRRPDHNTGNYVPYSCEQCVGSLNLLWQS